MNRRVVRGSECDTLGASLRVQKLEGIGGLKSSYSKFNRKGILAHPIHSGFVALKLALNMVGVDIEASVFVISLNLSCRIHIGFDILSCFHG